jgi:hypothetical protein
VYLGLHAIDPHALRFFVRRSRDRSQQLQRLRHRMRDSHEWGRDVCRGTMWCYVQHRVSSVWLELRGEHGRRDVRFQLCALPCACERDTDLRRHGVWVHLQRRLRRLRRQRRERVRSEPDHCDDVRQLRDGVLGCHAELFGRGVHLGLHGADTQSMWQCVREPQQRSELLRFVQQHVPHAGERIGDVRGRNLRHRVQHRAPCLRRCVRR